MRNRSSVVIIQKEKILLIKRVREGRVYYVFPGGGIEIGEKPEAAAKREAFEELGVEVKILECMTKINFNGTQFYYLAGIISGEVGTGNGEEYTSVHRETYMPMYVEISDLETIDVIPKELVKDILLLT